MTESQKLHRKSVRTSAHGKFDVVATNFPYGTICQTYVRALPVTVRDHVRVSTFRDWSDVVWKNIGRTRTGTTLIVSRLADIPENVKVFATAGNERRNLVFVEDMPVESISSRVLRLNVRDSHRLHIARERNLDAISAIIKRAISGLAVSKDRNRIVDAWIEGAKLVVLSPTFQRLYIPVKELERYLGNEIGRIKSIEIDEDGSYLYWSHADVHLGWEQLQGIVDPTTLVAAQRKSEQFNLKYGAAIRAVREERGLKQSDIKGIVDRHLRRIEHGQMAATSSTLKALAESHGMSLAEYLEELANRSKA